MATIKLTFGKVSWAIGAIAALMATASVVTWQIRSDRLEQLREENESLRSISAMRLPELVDALEPVALSIVTSVEERNRVAILEEHLAEANTELAKESEWVTELERKLEESEAERASLLGRLVEVQRQIAHALVEPGLQEIEQGGAVPIVRNKLFLGVESVYPSWVETNLAGRDVSFRAGETEEVRYPEQRCTIALVSIDASAGKATFQVACSGSEKGLP